MFTILLHPSLSDALECHPIKEELERVSGDDGFPTSWLTGSTLLLLFFPFWVSDLKFCSLLQVSASTVATQLLDSLQEEKCPEVKTQVRLCRSEDKNETLQENDLDQKQGGLRVPELKRISSWPA